MEPGEYDVAATAVGVVDEDAVLGPELVQAGDAIVALASSGLHCNGYSLVRHVLAASGADLGAPWGAGTLGDELLTPTRIYALDCLAAAGALPVRTWAHITGGGLAGNLGRVIPPGLQAVVDRATWRPGAVFDWVAETGGVSPTEMERTFNQGVGMVGVVAAEAANDLVALLGGRGVPSWVAGRVDVADGDVRARLVGARGTDRS
jgi:phosphoribosylformylglycinamidine cyclo-ligase